MIVWWFDWFFYCIFDWLFVNLFVNLSVNLFVNLFVNLIVCLFVCVLRCLITWLYAYLFAYWSSNDVAKHVIAFACLISFVSTHNLCLLGVVVSSLVIACLSTLLLSCFRALLAAGSLSSWISCVFSLFFCWKYYIILFWVSDSLFCCILIK